MWGRMVIAGLANHGWTRVTIHYPCSKRTSLYRNILSRGGSLSWILKQSFTILILGCHQKERNDEQGAKKISHPIYHKKTH